jgi:lipopolysaccharide transport system permease protein
LVLAMGNLFYRDVKYLFEIVLTVWMFVSSVLYPVDAIGGRMTILLRLNPMTPILDAYRSVLLLHQAPEFLSFGVATLLSLILFVLSWFAFHRAEFKFAENI